jgi:hypothetical protein
MTFCPEWLVGSPALKTSNAFHFWIYLVVSALPLFPANVTGIMCRFSLSVPAQFMNVLYVPRLSPLPSRIDPGTERISSCVVLPVWLMFDAYTHIARSPPRRRVCALGKQVKLRHQFKRSSHMHASMVCCFHFISSHCYRLSAVLSFLRRCQDSSSRFNMRARNFPEALRCVRDK